MFAAKTAGQEPSAVGPRVLRGFDFEERDEGNFEDQPMHFARVVGPGMPHWVRGRLADDAARSGRHSLRLDLNGGSALYRSPIGLIPVEAGARYRVTAHVRTTPLRFARARVSVSLADAEGELIPDGVRHSEPFAGGAEDEMWHPLNAQVRVDDERAAWLVIELGLLQPDAGGLETGDAGATEDLLRFRQDVRGSAWFDDVTVSRVPTVALERADAGGVVPPGANVRFWAVASDPSPPPVELAARATVRDAAGQVAWQGGGRRREATVPSGLPAVGFDFEVGRLPPGWYEAAVTVGAGEAATVRRTAVVVLAEDDEHGWDTAAIRPDPRLSADATGLPPGAWDALPDLARALGAGRVELPVWGAGDLHDPADDRAGDGDRLDRVAGGLQSAGVLLDAVFAGPTRAMADGSGRSGWAAVAAAADDPAIAEAMRADVSFAVARHAHQIARYRFGRTADADRLAGDGALRRAYDRFAQAVADLAAGPRPAVPWPARRDAALLAEVDPGAVTLRVPADVTPRQLPLYVADAARRGGAGLSIGVEPPALDRHGRLVRLGDLARRMVVALAGGATGITVPVPVVAREDGELVPTEDFLVVRTLARHLAGRDYAGRIPGGDVGEGVEAYLFAAPDGRGTLVAWSRSVAGGSSPATIEVDLGENARQVDLWGNASPLADRGRARVEVGAMPTLVVGVDAARTRLRQTVALDDPTIESSFEPHSRRLTFRNTFPHAVAGVVRLRPPPGWTAAVAGRAFSLDPGQELSRVVELQIPYNSDAGEHRLDVEVRLRGGPTGAEDVIRVPLTVRLGLSDVGLRTVARRDGGDLQVEQHITNFADGPINYTAFVVVPGTARQERLVLDLGPGQSAVKRYRFGGVEGLPAGTALRSGLRELEGTRILNDRVEF